MILKYAMKAGFGSLIGFLTGIGLKLAASFVMTFYFVKEWIFHQDRSMSFAVAINYCRASY
jgi:hypothetical protein